eukprot:scaffold12105_cov26-Prasinocladus_malaysianus.AAC.1
MQHIIARNSALNDSRNFCNKLTGSHCRYTLGTLVNLWLDSAVLGPWWLYKYPDASPFDMHGSCSIFNLRHRACNTPEHKSLSLAS